MQMARYWKPGQLLRLSVPATGCTAQTCRSMPTSLGFDIGTIDDDAAHVKQVQCISPPQLPHAWYELRQISLTSVVELYRP